MNMKARLEAKRMVIFLLLSAFAFTLYLLRSNVLGERMYFFMAINLFLAWIPYAISCAMLLISNFKESKICTLSLLPLGALWLLFFPNAPYLFTNYVHFSGIAFFQWGSMDFMLQPWYDFILFTSFI